MNEKLQARVDLFLTNTESIKELYMAKFFYQTSGCAVVCQPDQPIDIQGIRPAMI